MRLTAFTAYVGRHHVTYVASGNGAWEVYDDDVVVTFTDWGIVSGALIRGKHLPNLLLYTGT